MSPAPRLNLWSTSMSRPSAGGSGDRRTVVTALLDVLGAATLVIENQRQHQRQHAGQEQDDSERVVGDEWNVQVQREQKDRSEDDQEIPVPIPISTPPLGRMAVAPQDTA